MNSTQILVTVQPIIFVFWLAAAVEKQNPVTRVEPWVELTL